MNMNNAELVGFIVVGESHCFCSSHDVEKMKACKYYQTKEASSTCKHRIEHIYSTGGLAYCGSPKAKDDLVHNK